MADLLNFMLSPKVMDTILNNNFALPDNNYTDTTIYVGLGITFDSETFSFTKEPVSVGYTINPDPVIFSEPTNGIIRNTNAIEWEKAKENWTEGTDQIQYLGLYYRRENEDLEDVEAQYQYELVAVLPLIPAETVLIGEKMVLNPNTIQIKLANR